MTGERDTIYDELGVSSVVNATGTKIRIGETLIREEAREAMDRAGRAFICLSDLQAAASERISEVTGAEAGYVTNGASSTLTLAAAACIAGNDLETMARLPDTEGILNEIVMPRTHRNGYDHAFRAAGARSSTSARTITTSALGRRTPNRGRSRKRSPRRRSPSRTWKPFTRPPLAEVVEIAHEHDVPVIVDAAAELPPTGNLRAFVERGAYLVAFSGGKAIRSPQSSGILARRKELVKSVARQHLDMHAESTAYEPPEDLVAADKPSRRSPTGNRSIDEGR